MVVRIKGTLGASSLAVAVIAVFAAVLVLLFSSFGSGQEGPPLQCPFGPGGIGSFELHGNVLNSSFHNATSNASGWNASVNISIYNMSFSAFGEPQTVLINQTATNNTNAGGGNFTIKVGPGSCFAMYTLKVVAYNVSSWNAWEIGPSLPALPASALMNFFDNSTIYLQPAATLNLTSVNQTHNISFNYVIFDDSLGFPLAENFMTVVWNASVVVPRAKNYTIMMMKSPQFAPGVDNPFSTALPPQTISVPNASNYSNTEFVINHIKNLSFDMFTISGNISMEGNTTPINVTQVLVKLGMAGMVPPNSDVQIQGGTTVNQTAGTNQPFANYSVVVMGASSGIYQILEFYGANATAMGAGAGAGEYLAYFSNFTVTGNMVHNVTLKPLAGNYTAVTGFTNLNTSFVTINLSDASGTPLQDAHAEIKVDMVGHKTHFPTLRYMADQLSGGLIRIPILSDSNATLLVFNRQFAPLKFKLNVTNASREPNGIIRITMNAFKPRKFQANGSFEDFSGSKADEFKLTFMRNSDACNVFNASVASCRLFENDFGGADFNPLKVMATGKVNILSEINTTGVKVYFIGVDMIASGPPEASISDSALRTDTNGTKYQELFKFGSVAPNIYDMVVIGMPYNYTRLDDSQQINFTIRELFDDTGSMVWNSSQHPNADSIPDAWSDYNSSWLNVSKGGFVCNSADGTNITNATCFINTTTNYVWIKLLHFSDGEGGPQGSDTTPPAAPAVVNISAQLTGNVMVNWTDVSGETSETYIIYRSLLNITSLKGNLSNYSASVTNLTRLSEGVQTYIDNSTLNNTVYYYAVAAVDATGNLQNSTNGINMSNSYNVTVNDTVIPKVPANITLTTSDTSVTIAWLNVTQDVTSGADFFNLTYYIYRSAANQSANLSGGNVTLSNISTFVTSIAITAANSTTVTSLVKGTYHFAVLTADDGGNSNLTVIRTANYANISVTPATAATSTTSSSSGGGGGGGTVTPTEGIKVSKAWASLPEGLAEMNITRFDVSFKKLLFTVASAVANAELSVTKLDTKPVVKKDVPGTVYQYLRVDKTNLADSGISNVTIEFSVEKKWFDQTGGLVKNIVLQRYSSSSGEWTALSTAYTRMDQVYQYFEAKSPGFSIFAVTLKATALPTSTVTGSGEQANVSGAASANESETAAAGGALGIAQKLPVKTILIVVIALAVVGIGAFLAVRKGGLKGGLGGLLGGLKGARGGKGRRRSKSSDEEEAEKAAKEYESQQRSRKSGEDRDRRGSPPEAFN